MSANNPHTSLWPFFNTNPEQNLFTVCEGVPISDAIAAAACLLETVINALSDLDVDDYRAWSALYMAQSAKAIINSCEISIAESEAGHE